ncbi:MAG: Lon protease family protein [bacterium]
MKDDKQISIEKLRRQSSAETFSFATTEELDSLDRVIGQERAVESVSFGIDIDSPGYHMYAMGPPGTGKSTTVKKFLEGKAPDEEVPDDWCYVNNFEDSDKPRAIRLPAGKGCEFQEDMDELVDELENEIPRAFQGDDYQQEREKIQEKFQQKRREVLQDLEDKASERGFSVLQTPSGLVLAPEVDGEVISPDKINELDEEQREEINDKRNDMEGDLREAMREIRNLKQEAQENLRQLDREILGFAVSHLIDDLKEKYSEFEEVIEFLAEVQEDVLDNVKSFKNQGREKGKEAALAEMMGKKPSLENYRVNLLVDNCEAEGSPVVLESNPTYYNLLGRIEHKGQFGTMVTDYSMIKPGALHRANGGYLIIEARDVLTSPFAWDALKRALKNNEIKTEIMGQEYRSIQAQTLEPEVIPLDIKVIVIGDPLLYYLLYNLDEDFQELFKVKADFSVQTDWDDETEQQYARFIGDLCENEDLNHFTREGVAAVVEQCARMTADQKKLDTKFGDIVDLIRESSYWAAKDGKEVVDSTAVQEAIDKKIYRSNRIEERVRELIDEGTLLIDVEGEEVGQVNGISVTPLGDYSFGRPSRITARTHVGDKGIVNIERELEMGGQVHNKGVMILSGYLGGKFAGDIPLSLSASLTFEQLYEGVDGDSASSTELYALLSSLSGYPINQQLAVTGSVNQKGEVQAIGGVNEKIEGYFRVCKMEGLTGEQGVIIPDSNVQNLMLREEVIAAVREGQFHIYAIEHVDEGIELLTGVEAGEKQEDGTFPEQTVNYEVAKKLRRLAEKSREFAENKEEN